MNDILSILKKKKIQFFFLFYVLMLLPMFIPMAQNFTFIDKVAVFLVCGLLFAAISTLSLFISSKSEKVIYSVLLTVSIIPGAIYLAYLLFAQVMLEQNSVTSLFETNPEESKEFIAYYLSWWVIAGVILYAAIPIVLICSMKSFPRLKIRDHKIIFGVTILIILSILGVNRVSRSVYFVNFYKTFISYKLRTSYEKKSIAQRQKQDYQVTFNKEDTIPQVLVVVVGESLNKHHMSLYGYSRNTNPLLSQYGDSLVVYNDVIAPQVHTIPVVRSLLSMSDTDHPEYFTEKPSLYELFNRAGFDTYLITNQGFSEDCRTSYDVLFKLAKVKYNLSTYKQHDDIVLPVLDTILNDKKKNKLILIHLIGNHMAYEFRYPKEYIVFDNEAEDKYPDKPFLNEEAKKVIDKYDNSVMYNDFIINSIIQRLKQQSQEDIAMIYFSDHGEELYDYRLFSGHAYEKVSPAMCEIPFMLWMNPSFLESHKKLVLDKNRAFSTEDFIYSISDIAGLKYVDFDSSRSLFSPDFKVRERYVGEKKYESIKEKFE